MPSMRIARLHEQRKSDIGLANFPEVICRKKSGTGLILLLSLSILFDTVLSSQFTSSISGCEQTEVSLAIGTH